MFSTGPAARGSAPRQAFRKWGLASSALAATALTVGLLASTASLARSPEKSAESLPPVALQTLPEQAQQTYRLVLSGGPFPYRKDGSVFGNRERLLPGKARGYYREYTVPTPNSPDRGARRIVCGGERPTEPDACFYTADHYASFRLIAR